MDTLNVILGLCAPVVIAVAVAVIRLLVKQSSTQIDDYLLAEVEKAVRAEQEKNRENNNA